MTNKSIQKKYILVFQKTYGGQEAVEFKTDASISTVSIKPFTDIKMDLTKQKDEHVQKNTLAFYDAITNKFKNLEEFIRVLGPEMCPYRYKSETSFIGYIDNKYMNKLQLSFNDQRLGIIARNANGNTINIENKETLEIVEDIIEMIKDPNCDFVDYIQDVYEDKETLNYHISKRLFETIVTLRNSKKTFDNSCKEFGRINGALLEDINSLETGVLKQIESYKNFRELYRIRKQYLRINKSSSFEQLSTFGINPIESDETFAKKYEEAKQKTYIKEKINLPEIPGQISIFDNIK